SGANPAWSDAVDANLWRQRPRETAREGHDSALGGGKQFAAVACHSALGLVPSDVEYHACAARFHSLAHGATDPHRGRHINAPQDVELLLKRPLRRRPRENIGAGVVDPDVDLRPPVVRARHDLILAFLAR